MGVPNLNLTRPRDLDHLVQQLQDKLRDIREEFRRQQTNAAQVGSRFSAARPVEQNDVVRLVDLNELKAQFDQKLNAQGGGGGAVPPDQTPVDVMFYAQVDFLEPADDLRILFTPSVTPSLDPNGYLLGTLVHRGAVVHQSLEESPPPIGYWRWTGTQVEFPLADVPLHTDALHLMNVVVLP